MDTGYVDFKIPAGSDFAEPIFYQNEDGTAAILTGYTAAMQIRRTVEATTVGLALSSGSGLTIDGPAGKITVSISQSQGRTLCIDNERTTWVYDLEITSPGGEVRRILEGKVVVTPEVTR